MHCGQEREVHNEQSWVKLASRAVLHLIGAIVKKPFSRFIVREIFIYDFPFVQEIRAIILNFIFIEVDILFCIYGYLFIREKY